MESKIVGQLNPVEHDPDFFESEPYPIPYFNNKKIRIGFIEAKHQPYLIKADEVLQNFLKLSVTDRISHSQLVYNYYEEILKYGYTEPLYVEETQAI